MGNTFVKLDIIDLNGHIIDSIYSGYLYEKSTHTFLWDASENNSVRFDSKSPHTYFLYGGFLL